MSFSSPEITRIYLHRLLKGILPQEAGDSYVNNVFNDIHSSVISATNGNLVDPRAILSKYQPVILINDSAESKWKLFTDMIAKLATLDTIDQVANYLVFLESNQQQQQQQHQHTPQYEPQSRLSSLGHLQNSFLDSASSQEKNSFRSSSFTLGGKTLNELIQPYYYEHEGTLRDEEILQYLSYTLLGSTSTLFPFTSDGGIQIPSNVNYSIGGFLFTLLEPALLYKSLSTRFDKIRSQGTLSQIKLAFITEATSTYLGSYAKLVNYVFHQPDLTLRTVHISLYDEIIKLRLLNYFTKLVETSQSDFVSQLFKFSHHGDILIKEMAANLFIHSATPYYDLVFEWITNGEINNDIEKEFFVQCISDNYEKSLKDYVFIEDKIPIFFPSAICQQIYQIGKTIIFLKKYCKELKWANDLNRKYRDIIISKHNGLVHMSTTVFAKLIETEYKEIINFASSIIYNNFKLVDDIRGVNDVLIRKGDLADSILRKGFETLNEPSSSLTSHKLNRLLNEAIEESSMKNYPQDIIQKIDARLANHGSIGFDSFTLDYHSALPLIFDDTRKEYLRLFNFFFKVKRLSYMLNHTWSESRSFKDISSHVKSLKLAKARDNIDISEVDAEYIRSMNQLKKFSIVAFNMTKFMNKVTFFFNYEIIEKNFNKLIDLFESKDRKTKVTTDTDGNKVLAQLLPNASYLARVNIYSDHTAIGEPQLVANTYNDFNIDEIIRHHGDYVKKISRNKLLDTQATSSKGRFSGTFFIRQLNNLLSIVFKFLMINEEFYINILDLLSVLNTSEIDGEYVETLKKRLGVLNDNLYEILSKFQGCSDIFNNDLLNDDDPQLKYFGQVLCG